MVARTLSKSRFKLALECPTKVFYSVDPRYVNARKDDEFLEALADGGFQVGALAQALYRAEDPAAIEITVLSEDEQVRQTAELLWQDNVTIFEGTLRHGNLLARVDVLRKRGNVLELIEVKAKSWDRNADSLTGTTPRSNPIAPDWEPYVYDVAFQEHLLRQCLAEWGRRDIEVRPSLLLVDKTAINTVAGLGAMFPIVGHGRGRAVAISAAFDIEQLAQSLLVQVDASAAIRIAQNTLRKKKGRPEIVFDSLVTTTAAALARGDRLGPHVGPPCKKCEFYCEPAERSDESRSGWAECMETLLRKPVTDSREVSVFGLYDKADIQNFLDQKRIWLRDLGEDEIHVKQAADKISGTERHRLQWREVVHDDREPFLRHEDLAQAMQQWRWPLHFIDFETAAPALPFHAGQRPYQPILFQFSHHVVTADGTVRHASDCLITAGSDSPSIEVVRKLRQAIGKDDGTVLHWFPHERAILRSIRDEISARRPIDAAALIAFLDRLGIDQDSNLRMVDLGALVKAHVFLAGSNGSSSMKKFLRPILQQSAFLRQRYAQPIYGTDAMPSLNFPPGWVWWRNDTNGSMCDPYALLGQVLSDPELDARIRAAEEGEDAPPAIANGGAAMVAYAQLQQPGVAADERQRLEAQLRRYCELDTLAMVMVYEALRAWLPVRN